MATDYFYLCKEGTSNPPVIAENVGPYATLDEAKADWPGFREATDDEYAEYVDYWNARYTGIETPETTTPARCEELF